MLALAPPAFLVAMTGCAPQPSSGAQPTGASTETLESSSATQPSATSPPSPTPSADIAASLVGDTRNAWAFAPTGDLSALVVEGSVPSQKAWSTSKVLVVIAYLHRVVDGSPHRLTSAQRELISRALGASDLAALTTLKSALRGRLGATVTPILRELGDDETIVPDSWEGSMQWSVQQQVRLMAALATGRVINPPTSAYVLEAMHPIPSQAWGLGRVGASAFKGGWWRATSETRQMGLLDGYAVALITAGVGPAPVQSDGDQAHVEQLDSLAGRLAGRLRGR